MQPIIAALAFVIIGYTIGSMKLINQGNEALVERMGRFHRKLGPGLNFIVPVLDTIVLEDTTREQVLDIPPQNVITKDNVSLEADAVMFWRILDLEKTYYEIEDIEQALGNLVVTTIRSKIAQLDMEQTIGSRGDMNQLILEELDEATAVWGVKVTRADIQNIKPPQSVLESMELQRAAEIKKRAAILAAEGEEQAAISRAEGTKKSLELISQALGSQLNSREILRYLVAQNYVEASQKLGESPNAKIVFVDPANSTDMFGDLIAAELIDEESGQKLSRGKENGSSSHSKTERTRTNRSTEE